MRGLLSTVVAFLCLWPSLGHSQEAMRTFIILDHELSASAINDAAAVATIVYSSAVSLDGAGTWISADVLRVAAGTQRDGSGVPEDLLELQSSGSCDSTEEPNAFRSIWRLTSLEVLKAMAEQLAGEEAGSPGLVLRHGYSSRAWVGFSDEARLSCIRDTRLDLIDLFLPLRPELLEPRHYIAFAQWRQESVTSALSSFVDAYHALRPDAAIYVWGDPGHYRLDELQRSKSCEDWATWLVDGIVDGVFLEGPWIASATEEGLTPPRLYAAALGLLSRMDPLPMFVPTIPTEFAGEGVDIAAQLAQLRSEGPVPALGIVVKKPEHLEAALEALRNFEPDEI